jgi:hypothetical protein
MNEDGTALETVNHVGRHELARYFDSSRDGLPEFIAPRPGGRRDRIFHPDEIAASGYSLRASRRRFSCTRPGRSSPDGVGLNADDMQVDY